MRIKFTKTGASSAFGGFSPGDMLTCGEAMARHLVEEVKVAEYAQTPLVPANAAPDPDPAPIKSRKRK
jgi:phosphoribosylformylglycinamidine (FGAM) synthase-like amidotransferase family enzyme